MHRGLHFDAVEVNRLGGGLCGDSTDALRNFSTHFELRGLRSGHCNSETTKWRQLNISNPLSVWEEVSGCEIKDWQSKESGISKLSTSHTVTSVAVEAK